MGFLAGEGVWALLRWSRYTRQDAYRIACYVIPGSVILSNVLSPQYFIWAIPLVLLLAVEIFPEGRVRPLVLAGLLIAVAVTTTWIFPYNFVSSESNPNPYALIPNKCGSSQVASRDNARRYPRTAEFYLPGSSDMAGSDAV